MTRDSGLADGRGYDTLNEVYYSQRVLLCDDVLHTLTYGIRLCDG
jgi:hypothetical protein